MGLSYHQTKKPKTQNNMKKIFFTFTVLILFASCNLNPKPNYTEADINQPKNIILLIGDGMGITQFYAAYKSKQDKTNIARCKYIGLVNTSSLGDLITDSAASGTAIATGIKTNNGAIGVDEKGKRLKTILEIAEENEKATGLVATSTITHATPASFIAHNPNRNYYEDIALDFINSDIDVFIGGGKAHFDNRADSLNLLDSLKVNDFQVVTEMAGLDNIKTGKLAALLFDKHPPRLLDGREGFLEKSSMKAIESLNQDEDGFFLMIESSQIDWGGHDMNQEYVVSETVEFDNVVGKVLDFAEKNGETLVLITADHECGGMTVIGKDQETGEIISHFSTDYHTPVFVPLFAFGPGADEFTGLYENTEIFHKMMKAFGFSGEQE